MSQPPAKCHGHLKDVIIVIAQMRKPGLRKLKGLAPSSLASKSGQRQTWARDCLGHRWQGHLSRLLAAVHVESIFSFHVSFGRHWPIQEKAPGASALMCACSFSKLEPAKSKCLACALNVEPDTGSQGSDSLGGLQRGLLRDLRWEAGT